jgi:hypothetical protein
LKNAKKGISAVLSLYKPRVRVTKGNKSDFPGFGKNRFSYGRIWMTGEIGSHSRNVGPWRGNPPNRTGGAAALELNARLNPATIPRRTPVEEILSPSLRAHTGAFGSAAATKRASPRRFPIIQA